MIRVSYKDLEKEGRNVEPGQLTNTDFSDVMWIDLTEPTKDEQKEVEELIGTKFQTRQQAQEIESTSKYSETPEDIYINTSYYIDKGKTYETEPISFIIPKNGPLVSYHQQVLPALGDVGRRIKIRPEENHTSYGIFMTILETIIDYDADMEELLTREITRLSKVITSSSNIDKAILHRINELQE